MALHHIQQTTPGNPGVVASESQESTEEVNQEPTEEVTQESEEDSSTYIGRRQPETSPRERSVQRGRAEGLYRGYQDLLRGSTLENRRLFRGAAAEAEAGSDQ